MTLEQIFLIIYKQYYDFKEYINQLHISILPSGGPTGGTPGPKIPILNLFILLWERLTCLIFH